MLFEFKVNDELFKEWAKRTEHSFVYMIQTMIDVARIIGENTIPLTPVETTRLGKSFKWHILTDNSRMKVVQLQMSALNPETGYDYAWIQHENPHYHHSFGGMWFLKEGIIESKEGAFQIIEEDYLSLFTKGNIY